MNDDLYSPIGDNATTFSAPVVVVLLGIWPVLLIGTVALCAILFQGY